MKQQRGFAALEAILLVVVIAIVGFTAWTYYGNTRQSANVPSATADVPSAPQITTTNDLTAAEAALDQVDVDANASDSVLLDSELANF